MEFKTPDNSKKYNLFSSLYIYFFSINTFLSCLEALTDSFSLSSQVLEDQSLSAL